jgi:D-3-phosphoglycerate dehydrogenase / 2-oxoglutarate reductase
MKNCTINTLNIFDAPEVTEILSSVGDFIDLSDVRDEVLPELHKCEAYMASSRIRIDEEFLAAAPNLRVIGSPHTGQDHLDLPGIKKRGIKLFTITDERELLDGFTATSELTFGLLLTLVRNIHPAIEAAKAGDWATERFAGFQLYQKTFGIIGLGRLGTISARIAQGFGMRVLAYDVEHREMDGVEIVDMDELLAQSDVISLHFHLRPHTDGIINSNVFAKMKPGAIVLNTSRGRIINEADLLTALESGHLGGAGLDVIDGEWLTKEQLLQHPLIRHAQNNKNLLILPHIGGSTTESIIGARIFMAKKLATYLTTTSA